VDELPIVPPGYERFVKRPINLTIASVGPRVVRRFLVAYDTNPQHESRTPVTISGGRLAGVTQGMKLLVLDSAESEEVVVRTVGMRTASGVIIRWVEENPKVHFGKWRDYPRYPPIEVGWKLSTSSYKLLDYARTRNN